MVQINSFNIFEYRYIRIKDRKWKKAADQIRDFGETEIQKFEGKLHCIWQPQIGMGVHEGIILTSWPTIEDAAEHGHKLIANVDAVSTSSATIMKSISRANGSNSENESAFYSNRWFNVRLKHVDEFVGMSEAVWPDFESKYETKVVGLWQNIFIKDKDLASLLLVVRYPSLAHWQNSRYYYQPSKTKDQFVSAMKNRVQLTQDAKLSIFSIA